MKILHIFGANSTGGVGQTLMNTLRGSPDGYEHEIVDLAWRGQSTFPSDIKSKASISCLDFNLCLDEDLRKQLLKQAVQKSKADIVQAWGRNGNYYTGKIAKDLPQKSKLLWWITSARSLEQTQEDEMKKILLETVEMSDDVDYVIYASDEVRDVHTKLGFNPVSSSVIYNGVDTQKFKPAENEQAVRAIKSNLGIPASAITIGMIGRFDKNKDQAGFLMAASALNKTHPNVHFVFAGQKTDSPEMQSLVEQYNLQQNSHLLGVRSDMPRIYRALDIGHLNSLSEAFANVPMEAMATQMPFVQTAAGMPELTVRRSELIIPTRDGSLSNNEWINAVMDAWKPLVNSAELRTEIGRDNRSHIQKNFSLQTQVGGFHSVYNKLCPLGYVKAFNPSALKPKLPAPMRKDSPAAKAYMFRF